MVKKLVLGLLSMVTSNLHAVPDGTLLKNETFKPHAYDSLSQDDKSRVTQERYQEYVNWYNQISDVDFRSIRYMSDGLEVVGILAQPKDDKAKKRPVIIYNRGGSNDSGKMAVWTLKNNFYSLVKAGYCVLASQYRGNDGGQGTDHLGGDDVNDVLNLFAVAKNIESADTNEMFMVGYSRGGIMTYRALQAGAPVKAAVVISGVADLFLFETLRPDATPILASMIPNYATAHDPELLKRSVIYWPEAIKVPLLLLHGDADAAVDVSQSQKLATLLSELGRECELVIYPGADHFLKNQRNDINKRILEWFSKFHK